MFRGSGFGFQNFQQDPFFAGFQNQFQNFDNMLSFDPFVTGRNRDPFPAIDGARAPANDRRVAEREARGQEMNPFGAFGFGNMFGFGGFGRMFDNMERQMEQVRNDPNSVSYTKSSVMSYSNTGDGAPKVYEATTSTRKAGDTRETRKSVRDSTRGIEKLEVGHHIGDRGRVVERERDLRTGQQHDHTDYVGMREDASGDFEQEWRRRTGQHGNLRAGRVRHQPEEVPVHLAITDGRGETSGATGHERNGRSGKSKKQKPHYYVEEA